MKHLSALLCVFTLLLFVPSVASQTTSCPQTINTGQYATFVYGVDNIQMDVYTDDRDDWLRDNNDNEPLLWDYNKFIRLRAWTTRSDNTLKYIQFYFWVGNSTNGLSQTYTNGLGPIAGDYKQELPYNGFYKYPYNPPMSYGGEIYYWTYPSLPTTQPMLFAFATHDYYYENKNAYWVCPFSTYATISNGPVEGETNSSGLSVIAPINKDKYTISVEEGDGGNLFLRVWDMNCNNQPMIVIGQKTAYTLTISSVGNGTVNRSPSCPQFYPNDVITLTPTPSNSAYCFKEWTGADASLVQDNGNGTYSLTMLNRDMQVTARFGSCVNEENVSLTICESELPFLWNGIECTAAGSYDYPSLSADGKTDSLTHLTLTVQTLTVNPDEYITIDAHQAYNWKGHSGFSNLTKAGMYCDTAYYATSNHEGTYCPSACSRLMLTLEHHASTVVCADELSSLPSEWSYIFDDQHTVTITDTLTLPRTGDTYYIRDTLKMHQGIDSIRYTLSLRVVRPYNAVPDTIRRCSNLPAEAQSWIGHTDKEEFDILPDYGTYHDTLRTANGCDSIYYTLHFIEDQAYDQYVITYLDHRDTIDTRRKDTVYININDTYLWEGKTYGSGKADTLMDTRTLQTAQTQCDSVRMLTLYVLDNIGHIYDTICGGEQYPWRTIHNTEDTLLLTSGDYACHSLTHHQTDSVTVLHLTALTDTTIYQTAVICAGDTYSDDHFTSLTEEDVYTAVVPYLHHACDSVRFVLTLRVVQPVHATPDTIRQCINDGMQAQSWEIPGWKQHNDNELFALLPDYGEYHDTLRTDKGCDSIYYTLHFIADTAYAEYSTVTIDEAGVWHTNRYDTRIKEEHYINKGDSYEWEGQSYSSNKADTIVATVAYRTDAGCDSIRMLTLYVLDNVGQVYDTICDGNTYTWRTYDNTADTLLQTGGAYAKHQITHLQTDSLTILYLSVLEADTLPEERVSICYGERYNWTGHKHTNLRNSGIYHDVDYYDNGCVKTYYTLNLTVLPAVVDSIYEKSVCVGQTYYDAYFNGLTEANTYETFVPFSSNPLCDSVRYVLTLRLVQPVHTNDSIQVCAAELPFLWNGQSIQSIDDNGAQATLTSGQGCDSIVTLCLTIGDATHLRVHETFCEGGSFLFGDSTIYDEGVYEHTFLREGKCDSIVTLTLTRIDAPVTSITDSIVRPDVYPFGNHQLTESGIYRDTTYEELTHCMAITELTLLVKEQEAYPPVEASLQADTVCADSLLIPVHLFISEGKPVRMDLSFEQKALQAGLRDTNNLIVYDNQHNLFYLPLPHSDSYLRPDDYHLTARITDYADRITTLETTLTILYPSSVILQRWTDVLMVQNEQYNGGYIFSRILWLVDGQVKTGSGEHNGYWYEQGGLKHTRYQAQLTRADDGKTLCSCPVRIDPQQSDELRLQTAYVSLAKRVAHSARQVKILTNRSGIYTVYAIDGKRLFSGYFGEQYFSPDIDFPAAVPQGTYLIQFTTDKGEKINRKWMVR